jgi:hypothetical protein
MKMKGESWSRTGLALSILCALAGTLYGYQDWSNEIERKQEIREVERAYSEQAQSSNWKGPRLIGSDSTFPFGSMEESKASQIDAVNERHNRSHLFCNR